LPPTDRPTKESRVESEAGAGALTDMNIHSSDEWQRKCLPACQYGDGLNECKMVD